MRQFRIKSSDVREKKFDTEKDQESEWNTNHQLKLKVVKQYAGALLGKLLTANWVNQWSLFSLSLNFVSKDIAKLVSNTELLANGAKLIIMDIWL